jgi:hypothetical protein
MGQRPRRSSFLYSWEIGEGRGKERLKLLRLQWKEFTEKTVSQGYKLPNREPYILCKDFLSWSGWRWSVNVQALTPELGVVLYSVFLTQNRRQYQTIGELSVVLFPSTVGGHFWKQLFLCLSVYFLVFRYSPAAWLSLLHWMSLCLVNSEGQSECI